MTLSNKLTLGRIVSILVFVVFFYLQPSQSGVVQFSWLNLLLLTIYVLIVSSDALDGYLARKWQETSKFGAFLDPVADKLIVVTALVLLIDYYQQWFITIPSLIIIIREFMVTALREWMSEVGRRSEVNVIKFGKLKTILQMVAIGFLLYQQPFLSAISFQIAVILLLLATMLTLWSGIVYLRVAIKTFDT